MEASAKGASASEIDHAVLEQMPTAAMLLDRDRRVTFMNTAGKALFNLSDEEVRSIGCPDLFKKAKCLTDNCCIRTAESTGEVVSAADELACGDRMVPIKRVTSAVRNEKGEAITFLQLVHDVSTEVLANRDLAVYKSLAESANDGIAIISHLGKITYCNPACYALFAIDGETDSIVGKRISNFWPVEERTRILATMLEAASEKGWSGELDFIDKNGDPFVAATTLSPIRGSDGKAPSFSVIIRDVTEAKRALETTAVIHAVAEAAHEADDLTDLLKRVHGSLASRLTVENFYVALYDESTGTYTFPFHVDSFDEVEPGKPYSLPGSMTDYVRRSGEMHVVRRKEYDRLVADGEVEAIGTPSEVWIGVPLRVNGQTLGVIGMQSYDDANAFGQSDIDLLQLVSGNVASAMARKLAEDTIHQQHEAILDLSTPVVELAKGVLLVPLIGVIDTARSEQMMERLLEAIVAREANVAVVDVSGVPVIDTSVAQHLLRAVSASKMLGTEVILTGFNPEIAQTLVQLNVDFSTLRTRGSLRAGVQEALRLARR